MKQLGFALIMFMLILSILTSWVVANMRWIHLDLKTYADLTRFQERMLDLEEVGEQIARQINLNNARSDCLATRKQETWISEIPSQGCATHQHYRYSIIDLGLLPCIKLISKQSTHHWLVTVMDERLPHKALQLHIARGDSIQPCPSRQVAYISEGVLTRYYLLSD